MFRFEKLHIDKAFFGVSGIHPQHGCTDYNMEEIATRQQMWARSAQKIIAADASKMNVTQTYNFCDLAAVNALVTNAPPSALASTATTIYHV